MFDDIVRPTVRPTNFKSDRSVLLDSKPRLISRETSLDCCKNHLALFLALFGIGLLLLSDFWLLSLQGTQARDLEIVKNQIQNSQKSLVSFPATNWRFVAVFSMAALSLGAGLGYWFAKRKR